MSERQIMERHLMTQLGQRGMDIEKALDHMQQTRQLLNDYVVPSQQLRFNTDPAEGVQMTFGDFSSTLHRNAVSHIAGRFGITGRDLLTEIEGPDWKRTAFVDRLNMYANHTDNKNVLVRRVGEQARAVLSDRYRRLNTAEIFIAFLTAAQERGAMLIDAAHTDLRNFLEVIHPEIIEVPTEKNGVVHMVYGAQIRNSDFGAGKLQLNVFGAQVVCLNGMVGKEMLSNIHLGSRIEDTGVIQFTDETMIADTKARALAVRDIMQSVYSPENLQREREIVVEAADIELDFSNEIKQLPRMGVMTGEVDMLTKTLMESNPEDGVTGKNTLWKLAQGLTAVANQVTPGRKRDLQDIASSLIQKHI